MSNVLTLAREAARSARLQGAPFYEGMPCKTCHGTQRYTANRACTNCTKAARRLAYDTTKATIAQRAYRAKKKNAGQQSDIQAMGQSLLMDL